MEGGNVQSRAYGNINPGKRYKHAVKNESRQAGDVFCSFRDKPVEILSYYFTCKGTKIKERLADKSAGFQNNPVFESERLLLLVDQIFLVPGLRACRSRYLQ